MHPDINFNQEYFQEMYNPTEIQYSLKSDFKFIVSANWFLCLPPPPPPLPPPNLIFHPEHVTSYNTMNGITKVKNITWLRDSRHVGVLRIDLSRLSRI